MLKIKDNVDLKELKKFGFKEYGTIWKVGEEHTGETSSYILSFEFGERNYFQGSTTGVSLIVIDPQTREISEYIDDRFEMYVDIQRARLDGLYELIKNDLVERVV